MLVAAVSIGPQVRRPTPRDRFDRLERYIFNAELSIDQRQKIRHSRCVIQAGDEINFIQPDHAHSLHQSWYVHPAHSRGRKSRPELRTVTALSIDQQLGKKVGALVPDRGAALATWSWMFRGIKYPSALQPGITRSRLFWPMRPPAIRQRKIVLLRATTSGKCLLADCPRQGT